MTLHVEQLAVMAHTLNEADYALPDAAIAPVVGQVGLGFALDGYADLSDFADLPHDLTASNLACMRDARTEDRATRGLAAPTDAELRASTATIVVATLNTARALFTSGEERLSQIPKPTRRDDPIMKGAEWALDRGTNLEKYVEALGVVAGLMTTSEALGDDNGGIVGYRHAITQIAKAYAGTDPQVSAERRLFLSRQRTAVATHLRGIFERGLVDHYDGPRPVFNRATLAALAYNLTIPSPAPEWGNRRAR